MCGIFGYTNYTPEVQRLLPTLALAMSARGRDSWGVVGQYKNSDGTYSDSLNVVRDAADITEGFFDNAFDWAIYHTRGASVGSVCIANAHPFTFAMNGELVIPETTDEIHNIKDVKLIGVHNGHISNHGELRNKYKRFKFDVDSQHVYAHIANGNKLSEIEGWGALVWWEAGKINFAQFHNPDLHIARIKSNGEYQGLVWASTKTALEIAGRLGSVELEFFHPLEENRLYFCKYQENVSTFFGSTTRLDFGPRHRVVMSSTTSYWKPDTRDPSVIGEDKRTRNVCGGSTCNNEVDRKKEYFCRTCVERIMQRYGSYSKVDATLVDRRVVNNPSVDDDDDNNYSELDTSGLLSQVYRRRIRYGIWDGD